MDDTNNLAPRERPVGGAPDSLQTRTPFLALDIMPREPHLLDYLNVLRKHQWLILFFLLTVVSIVSIATFRMQPVYEATARVEIDRENNNAIHFADSDSYEAYEDLEDYITTQSKILTSETLAMHTVKSMGLDTMPQFGGMGKVVRTPAPGSDAALERPAALGAFLGGLSVKRVPNSRLLDVSFVSGDPTLAAHIVNTHLNNFIEDNFRSRFEAANQASTWLAGQLNEMRIKVENAEDARITYERENQIWTIDQNNNDITTEKLADLNKQLTAAQTDRINKEAVYQLVQTGNYDAISAVRGSTVIQEILKQQSQLNAAHTDALSQYGPKFPKVIRLEAQIKELDQLMTREKTNIGDQVEAEYRGARQRELLLTQALDQQKIESSQMAERLIQYDILKRDAETNKQIYDGMLQKLKEAGITAGLRSSNIRVVDPALIPSGPSGPNRARNIMLSIFVGLIGGIGLALVREYFDNTVKTPDDIETLAHLPSLAVVPALANSDGKRRGRFSRLLKSPVISKDGRAELISHNMPQSQMSEAFRALRTSLLLSQADHPPQVILMTSALPREGKTTAAVNLAVTLAQLGDKTLLVDADLRKPGINRALSLVDGKHAGLSSYLAGVSTLDLITVPHPAISNLAAIPTGPIPPNPADLLSSRRLTELIAELRTKYKFVVIDSPPIMAATDAVILSVLVDGVLMVVRSGETPKEAFTRTRDLLAGVKCHMLGVVLNAVDASSPDYYYSYRYYPYSYGGYGREDDSKKTRKARRAEGSNSELGQD